jgi:diacylglycerol kinase
MFSPSERVRSFLFAFKGCKTLVIEQHNARVHLLAVLVVCVLAALLSLSRWEWVALVVAMALVLVAEALNTALEYLADVCHPEQHPLIAKSKDVAAAAVLLAAVAALLIGALVFLPALSALAEGTFLSIPSPP